MNFVKIIILQNYHFHYYRVLLLNTSNYISVSGQMYPSFLSPEINSNDIKLERIKIKSDDRFPNLSIHWF